jgi:hypothetical protein
MGKKFPKFSKALFFHEMKYRPTNLDPGVQFEGEHDGVLIFSISCMNFEESVKNRDCQFSGKNHFSDFLGNRCDA